MKVIINYEKEEVQFPILMQEINDKDHIILVTEEDEGSLIGTTVSHDNNHEIGNFSRLWMPSKFQKFNGKVTLEND